MYVAGIVFDTVDEFTNVDLIQYDIGKDALTAFAGCLTSMVFVVSLSWNAKWWELEDFQHKHSSNKLRNREINSRPHHCTLVGTVTKGEVIKYKSIREEPTKKIILPPLIRSKDITCTT